MNKTAKFLRTTAFIIILSTLLAVFSLPEAEDYSVPTLYIDNRAWYMYSLFPLTEQNGIYLVPSSFFGAVDGVEITFDSVHSCLLMQHGDRYVSINVDTLNALVHTGQVKKTYVSHVNDEYFVDSALCAQALGFTTEVADIHEKTVLRIRTRDDLIDFKTLVERNQLSEVALPGATEGLEVIKKRQDKNLSFLADFTKMTVRDQVDFIDYLAEKKLSATIIIKENNLTDADLLKNLTRANALGCSFIIRANNTIEVSRCNELLGLLFRNKTRLVYAPDGLKVPLNAIGYIFCESADAKVSADPTDFDFAALTTVEITNFNTQTKNNMKKWIEASNENDVFVSALSPRTGN